MKRPGAKPPANSKVPTNSQNAKRTTPNTGSTSSGVSRDTPAWMQGRAAFRGRPQPKDKMNVVNLTFDETSSTFSSSSKSQTSAKGGCKVCANKRSKDVALDKLTKKIPEDTQRLSKIKVPEIITKMPSLAPPRRYEEAIRSQTIHREAPTKLPSKPWEARVQDHLKMVTAKESRTRAITQGKDANFPWRPTESATRPGPAPKISPPSRSIPHREPKADTSARAPMKREVPTPPPAGPANPLGSRRDTDTRLADLMRTNQRRPPPKAPDQRPADIQSGNFSKKKDATKALMTSSRKIPQAFDTSDEENISLNPVKERASHNILDKIKRSNRRQDTATGLQISSEDPSSVFGLTNKDQFARKYKTGGPQSLPEEPQTAFQTMRPDDVQFLSRQPSCNVLETLPMAEIRRPKVTDAITVAEATGSAVIQEVTPHESVTRTASTQATEKLESAFGLAERSQFLRKYATGGAQAAPEMGGPEGQRDTGKKDLGAGEAEDVEELNPMARTQSDLNRDPSFLAVFAELAALGDQDEDEAEEEKVFMPEIFDVEDEGEYEYPPGYRQAESSIPSSHTLSSEEKRSADDYCGVCDKEAEEPLAMDLSLETDCKADWMRVKFKGPRKLLKVYRELEARSSSSWEDVKEDVTSSASYYAKHVFGKYLPKALAEIVWFKPEDPIEYLAHWLLRRRGIEDRMAEERRMKEEVGEFWRRHDEEERKHLEQEEKERLEREAMARLRELELMRLEMMGEGEEAGDFRSDPGLCVSTTAAPPRTAPRPGDSDLAACVDKLLNLPDVVM